MRHTISVIVENKPGVLARVAGLFSRRGFNIESLAVGTTEDPNISRMTIVANGDEQDLEQIIKQLYKLIDTLRVFDIPKDREIQRELVLIKVSMTDQTRKEITEIAELFKAKIADLSEKSMVIEISDEEEKVNNLEKMLQKFGIMELVRTGKIALQKGGTK
ncbi:acetolactate synthase small subunit [candidate division WOR-1 bacterium RIFOXYA12_FULL_43_27]|uniref:Acetolactate synthase small subunit n=1 Tax=candidate division WOR-1 bacterium RIFOXYC2_FULL_46_14 TaxID=1802587 RepID=A0A1F4U4F2_UNCSA|nr:MAG: acetolactate synthase small subunit [candidate division WOR-1 bacterium RIFOXYA12_FULL_43_27]OGC20876.1 MAG: acetolactate synthase small subunit [candidate division WOR-1 bacterium RIFOXYB2_FULL_46_45]OGC31386.1 MAG: acetolactate synthase small subunit [candidate division WOR-1 bacterium RIFOXYA2_FULL_46_56]OGC39792.1 MAG: acetolactate synthase small subunit [candidate division WOR-1 bacterium RIFOXYC2_FULL_46_14]